MGIKLYDKERSWLQHVVFGVVVTPIAIVFLCIVSSLGIWVWELGKTMIENGFLKFLTICFPEALKIVGILGCVGIYLFLAAWSSGELDT